MKQRGYRAPMADNTMGGEKKVSIGVDADIWPLLNELCKKRDIPRGALLRPVIAAYVQREIQGRADEG